LQVCCDADAAVRKPYIASIVPLQYLKTSNFRCLEDAELEADPHYNLIYGANASGKTSLLEAIAYLGRGKSFRGATTQDLVRHGQAEFVLLGKVDSNSRTMTIGVRNSRDGLEVRIDGENAPGAAALAEALPLQVVDPDVHNLIAGGPEMRRRYLDWIAFHVEHGYLESWRRFRRAQKQRNAALRAGAAASALIGWDREFLEAAQQIHESRLQVVELIQPVFEETGSSLLGHKVALEYRQGWNNELSLEEALAASAERDREQGSTQAGPQRGDVRLVMEDRLAKKLVSRGQQKLLACALVLTATELAQTVLEQPLLLLLDDPAAELDSASLERLMARVIGLGCQVVATALAPDKHLFPDPPALFHVEQGVLKKAG
jgi:DNA replication and repair protein RecF